MPPAAFAYQTHAGSPRNGVQPAAKGWGLADMAGSSGQGDECRLECVIGVRPVTEHSAADTDDKSLIPVDDFSKGLFICVLYEPPQQVAVVE